MSRSESGMCKGPNDIRRMMGIGFQDQLKNELEIQNHAKKLTSFLILNEDDLKMLESVMQTVQYRDLGIIQNRYHTFTTVDLDIGYSYKDLINSDLELIGAVNPITQDDLSPMFCGEIKLKLKPSDLNMIWLRCLVSKRNCEELKRFVIISDGPKIQLQNLVKKIVQSKEIKEFLKDLGLNLHIYHYATAYQKLQGLPQKVNNMEKNIIKLRQDMALNTTQLRQDTTQLRQDMAWNTTQLRQDMTQLRQDMRQDIRDMNRILRRLDEREGRYTRSRSRDRRHHNHHERRR